MQHDSSDCGAACLASVTRYWGGSCTIECIRNASGTTQYGATMLGLYQAAAKLGIEATGYEASVDDIISYKGILILHIRLPEGLEHYVVCYGFENSRFVIWDPAKGIDYYSVDHLKSVWHSRKCLGLVKGNGFRHKSDDRREKSRWLKGSLKPDRDILVVSVFIGILISALGLAMAVYTRKLLDEIIPSGDIRLLLLSSLLVFILLVARILFTAIRQLFLLSQGRDFNIRVVRSFYSSLLFLPKAFFDTRKTGDFVARLNDTMRIQKVISDISAVYIIDMLVITTTLILIFHYSAVAGFISLAAIPVLFMLVYVRNKSIIRLHYDAMAGYALNESNYISSLKGITEIKGLGWYNSFIDRGNAIFSSFQGKAFSLGRIKIGLGLSTGLAGTVYLVLLLLYSATEVIKMQMTTGELMALLTLSSSLLPSILNLALLPIPFNEAKVAVNRMFEFTRMDAIEKEEGKEGRLTIESLRLEGVTFRFPGQRLLLKDISMLVERGRITALVGESGSGKTTMAGIIMRFYDPEKGMIRVNEDISGTALSYQSWHASVGLIPQEIHIFNGTLIENIIGEVTEEKLNRLSAIISANGLEQFFNSFPAGITTLLGEEGVKLSGGQRQLIAFIRILIHDPDIIIIDEGTSNMDLETEHFITGLIRRIKAGKGILLITHRMGLIRHLCDRIYVLEGGVISGCGTHEELLMKENLYKRLNEEYV